VVAAPATPTPPPISTGTPTPAPPPIATATPAATPTPGSAAGPISHLMIVAEENHGFSDIVGVANEPYINGLINSGGLAVNYYADTHPSIGNYLDLASGVVISNDDALDPSGCGSACDVPNVFRSLTQAGVSWKAYAEDLPSAGYLGGDSGGYAVRHNPAPYFVANDPALSGAAGNIVPFSQLAQDLAAHQLPQFIWVTPNLQDDMHDGTPAQADSWLSANIAPVLASPDFAGGVLAVWWDEGNDNTNGGGQVAFIMAGSTVKAGYQGGQFYQHGGTERLIYDTFGLGTPPGEGATSNSMSDFFR
jgi:phosphatidylinositol-3-phosphatase